MAQIYLHGDLTQFGGPYTFDVASTSEAIRALCGQIKGFRRRLSNGHFRIIRKSILGARDLRLVTLSAKIKASQELHIVPVVQGSGKGGGKAILGIALVAAAFVMMQPELIAADGTLIAGGFGTPILPSIFGMTFTYGQLAGIGAAMILGGVSQMLSPAPKTNTASSAQNSNSSSLFGGPVNVTAQGTAVPLVYGEFIAGSTVISSALTAENVALS